MAQLFSEKTPPRLWRAHTMARLLHLTNRAIRLTTLLTSHLKQRSSPPDTRAEPPRNSSAPSNPSHSTDFLRARKPPTSCEHVVSRLVVLTGTTTTTPPPDRGPLAARELEEASLGKREENLRAPFATALSRWSWCCSLGFFLCCGRSGIVGEDDSVCGRVWLIGGIWLEALK